MSQGGVTHSPFPATTCEETSIVHQSSPNLAIVSFPDHLPDPPEKRKAQTGFPSNISCHMGHGLCIHNHILHSGLELSNGLDCYGSQKLRQLRVRAYSVSNLAQTTIAYIMHVICNLIQVLKSERRTSSHVARKVTQNTRPHM